MWINRKDKWLFVSTPKAGTHTMYKILANFGGERVGMGRSKNHSNQVPPYANDFYKFTTVRNPYERAVSSWFHLMHSSETMNGREAFRKKARGWMGGGDSFQHFTRFLLVRDKYIKPDQPMMFNGQHEWHNGIQFDKVIKIECLVPQLATLPFWDVIKGKNEQEYSFASERKPWKEFYTDEDWANVTKAYAADFKEFGYDTV